MIKKKFLLAGAVTLLLLLVSLTGASAAAEITPDTSWYTGHDTTYTLNTPEQLAGLAAIVNGTADGIKADSFEGVTILLGSDILFNNPTKVEQESSSLKEWKSIGSLSGNSFNGTFDGQNHTITGLYSTSNGLFGQTSNATIRNLTLEYSTISTSERVPGLIVGYGDSSLTVDNIHIKNCYIKDSSITSGDVGGIVGDVIHGTFTNCTVSDTKVICYNCDYAGGIAGYIDDVTSFTDCAVNNTIIVCAKSGAGGVGGYAFNDVSVTSCTVNSCYVQSVYDNYVGGVLGFGGGEVAVDGCHVSDSVLKAYKHSVGGIVGYANHASFVNNPSTVKDTIIISEIEEYVGGLLGSSNRPVTISADNCAVSNVSAFGGFEFMKETVGPVIGRGNVDNDAKSVDVEKTVVGSLVNEKENKNTRYNSTGTTYDESKWIVSKKTSETVNGVTFGTSEKTFDVPVIKSDLTTKQSSETTTAKSPFPILGILAGIGAAALFLRRK